MTKFHVTLAAVLCAATSISFAQQAAQPPAAAPAATPTTAAAGAPAAIDPVQELDEIMVRGKRLLDQIADEEDDFYALFNKVNKDDRYDTSCVYLNLDPDSLAASIKSRVCIPGFVADAMADFQVWKMRCQPAYRGIDEFDCLDRNGDGRLSWDEASARQELESDFVTLDEDLDSKISRDEYNSGNQATGAPIVYQPPPPQLVLMEGTKKWYDHMMSVIQADDRLGEMAGKLDDLYRELAQVQSRYEELDPNANKPVQPVSTKRTTGPRVQ